MGHARHAGARGGGSRKGQGELQTAAANAAGRALSAQSELHVKHGILGTVPPTQDILVRDARGTQPRAAPFWPGRASSVPPAVFSPVLVLCLLWTSPRRRTVARPSPCAHRPPLPQFLALQHKDLRHLQLRLLRVVAKAPLVETDCKVLVETNVQAKEHRELRVVMHRDTYERVRGGSDFVVFGPWLATKGDRVILARYCELLPDPDKALALTQAAPKDPDPDGPYT
eukprot:5611736-Prymnesium_polylepis.2